MPPKVPEAAAEPLTPPVPAVATVATERLATFFVLARVLVALPPGVATPEVVPPPFPPLAICESEMEPPVPLEPSTEFTREMGAA
jgi:hypothetical protein